MALRGAAAPALPPASSKPRAVREMFDRIAPRYDLLNRVMSVGLDRGWRRRALAAVQLGADDRVVDLACGTGDLSDLAAGVGARVVGVDFAGNMLRGARRRAIRAAWVQADAGALPLPDGFADVVCSGFALRNFASLPPVFEECARILAPGGRLALLDVDRPRGRWLAGLHAVYFDRVVPQLGAWLSDSRAYAYLPQSTAYLPSADVLRAQLEAAGFAAVEHRSFLFGAVQLWTGVRSDGR